MKSKSIGSLILLAILAPSCGGGGGSDAPPKAPLVVSWQTQQRSPTSSDLRSCIFANVNQGIIAGKNGTIFRTDDGGTTWTQQEFLPSSRTGDILAMSAYGQTIVAAGKDATTGSRLWDGRSSVSWVTPDAAGTGPATSFYTDINVSDPGVGNVPGTWWALRNDAFIDYSFNGTGNSFTPKYFPAAPPLWPAGPPTAPQHPVDWTETNAVLYVGVTGLGLIGGRDNGWVGHPLIVGDPGTTADDIPANPGHTPEGQIARTLDFGTTWLRQTILPSHPKTFRRLFITTATTGVMRGYAVADSTTDNGHLYVTNYGVADQWDRVTDNNVPNAAPLFRALSFPVNDQAGWVVGDAGAVWKVTATVNAGPPVVYTYTWAQQNTGPGQVTTANLYAVSFADNNTGYAVGDGGVVIKTTNGGTNWTRISKGTPAINFNAVSFTDDGVKGLAVGDAGAVFRTTDGGLNWTNVGPVTGNVLHGVSVPRFGTGNVAYLCGAGGTLQRNPDAFGAGLWAPVTGTLGTDTYRAILFPQGDTNGVCVGNVTAGGSKILQTSNGTTWNVRTAPTVPNAAYNALSTTPDGGKVYAASGTAGLISDSTDVLNGFVAWNNSPSPGSTLTLLSMASPSGGTYTAFTGANNGRVLRLPFASAVWETPPGGAPFGAGVNPVSLSFQTDFLGTVVASDGKIWTSVDGASTWTQSFAHTKDSARALWMSQTNIGLGYVVCNDGTILKTTTGGK